MCRQCCKWPSSLEKQHSIISGFERQKFSAGSKSKEKSSLFTKLCLLTDKATIAGHLVKIKLTKLKNRSARRR